MPIDFTKAADTDTPTKTAQTAELLVDLLLLEIEDEQDAERWDGQS